MKKSFLVLILIIINVSLFALSFPPLGISGTVYDNSVKMGVETGIYIFGLETSIGMEYNGFPSVFCDVAARVRLGLPIYFTYNWCIGFSFGAGLRYSFNRNELVPIVTPGIGLQMPIVTTMSEEYDPIPMAVTFELVYPWQSDANIEEHLGLGVSVVYYPDL